MPKMQQRLQLKSINTQTKDYTKKGTLRPFITQNTIYRRFTVNLSTSLC